MFFCEECGRDHTNPTCPRCGRIGGRPKPNEFIEPVSVVDDSLDSLIEKASRPSLATLLKRGIKNGTIVPTHDYAGGNTPTP
jgi:hypothetical protein